MNKRFIAGLFLLFAVCLTVSAPLRAEGPVIKISSDPWEPWVLGAEGEVASGGIAVEAAQELFRRVGLQSETVIYPYERCLHQMRAGERDVLLMVKKTPEREQFMLFSDVAATDPQLIYYATDRMTDFNWNAWEDLKPYTVGGVQGFNYGDFGDAAKAHGISTEMIASDAQNIKKLLNGRIDLIILNRSTANYYMKQNPQHRGKLRAAGNIISDAEFHFGLSKKGQAAGYLAQINAALGEMKADGTLDKILGLNLAQTE